MIPAVSQAQSVWDRLSQLTPRAPWRHLAALLEEAARRAQTGRTSAQRITVTFAIDKTGRVRDIEILAPQRYEWE